ncbi:MAG TPA: calcium/proton exchanger [Gemmatimonadales bacterium]|nr:calcium/proton exchanger [Gemmatimonadales bacterium]
MNALDDLRTAATEQAAALGADFVGSEHVFLAWRMTATGAAADTMTTAGLTADAFRELLGASNGRPRRSTEPAERGTLSSQAQRALQLAGEIAQTAGRPEATLDDVGVALIREPRGAIARALTQFQLKPSQLRKQLEGSAPRPQQQRPARPPAQPRAQPPAPQVRPAQTEVPAKRSPRRDPEIDDIPEARAPERPRLIPSTAPRPREVRPSFWRQIPATSILVLALPIAIWLDRTGGNALLIFGAACLGVIPLAALMGTATEHLAERSGPTLGGLLNAGFGNAAELIIAIVALRAGYVELVQASITGSILGNLLLILGLSLATAGAREPLLKFNRTTAGMSAAMLAVAVAGLVFPALVHAAHPLGGPGELRLSVIVAAILALMYLASLLFVFRTHRRLFASGQGRESAAVVWSMPVAIGVLALATVGVAVASEILVGTVGAVTTSLGVSQGFVGLILIPIIGNAAEHATAIVAARRGKVDLALQIALGSSTQVALLVAPILVLVSAVIGGSMNLVFAPFQVAALGVGVIVSSLITVDGESHWLEGVQLLALYVMIAAAAWFI